MTSQAGPDTEIPEAEGRRGFVLVGEGCVLCGRATMASRKNSVGEWERMCAGCQAAFRVEEWNQLRRGWWWT